MNEYGADEPLYIDKQSTPPASGPEIYVLRLGAQERLSFCIYSRALFGVWVHFDAHAKRSSPHYTNETRCPGCQDQLPKRWKGFIHCFCVDKKQQVFLELTPASANAMLNQIAKGETLRGKHIVVERTKGKNGRLIVRMLPSSTDSEQLPQELDPEPSLTAMWGLKATTKRGLEFPCRPSRNGTKKT